VSAGIGEGCMIIRQALLALCVMFKSRAWVGVGWDGGLRRGDCLEGKVEPTRRGKTYVDAATWRLFPLSCKY
jgi:hypothetical protein